VQQSAISEFTEADKAKVLSVPTKITEEDKDKYHVYHDIYHVLKDSCDCRIPENKILPEREDLLCFCKGKCWTMRSMGVSMSASSSWWKTFQQRIHSLLKAVCFMFLTTPKSAKRFFVVIIISLEQRTLKVFKVAVKNVLAWAKRKIMTRSKGRT
jgi:hypothetical protein